MLCSLDNMARLRRAEGRRALQEGARFLLYGPLPTAAAPPPASPSAPTPASGHSMTAAAASGAPPMQADAAAAAGLAPQPVLLWLSNGGASLRLAALPDSWEAGKALRKRLEGVAAAERLWLLQGSPPREVLECLAELDVHSSPGQLEVRAGSALFMGPLLGAAVGGAGGGAAAGWEARLKALLRRAGGAEGAGIADARCFSLLSGCSGGSAFHLQLPPQGNGRSRDEWVTALSDLSGAAGV